ncbi:MAG: YjfB family protein [Candidatus Sericytochromatia bacterium]|nr:YjfB family protein [Candidatus Sericytochromatia bacterium]
MDVGAVGAAERGEVMAQVQPRMLRKAIDTQASQVLQLLQAIPEAPQPAHLGAQVDVRA